MNVLMPAYVALLLVVLALILLLQLSASKGFRALGGSATRDDPWAGKLFYLGGAQVAAADGAMNANLAMTALPCAVDVANDGVVIHVATRNGLRLAPIELSSAAQLRLFEQHGLASGVPAMLRLSEGQDQHFLMVRPALGTGAAALLESLYGRLSKSLRDARRTPSSWSNWRGAAIMLPVLIVLVSALLYGAMNRRTLVGPETAVVDAAGQLWLADSDRFMRLDAAANAVATSYRFADLGMKKGVSDWQFLSDGSVLLGDFADGRIQHCGLSPLRCTTFDTKLPKAAGAFKFHYDESAKALYVVDSDAHRAFVWREGKAVDLRNDSWGLCYPNRIDVDADGAVYLADTNNHRLLRWSSTIAEPPVAINAVASNAARSRCDGPLGKQGGTVTSRSIRAFDGLDPASTFPTDFVRLAGGRTAVLLNDARLRRGDVVILHEGQAPVRVPIETGTDAWALVAWQDSFLVVDALNARVQRFDADGKRLPDVGEAHLAPLRTAGAAKRQRAHVLMIASGALVVFGLVAVILLSLRARKQQIERLLTA